MLSNCDGCDPETKCPECNYLQRCGGCHKIGIKFKKHDLFCDELCSHSDLINSFCWKLWRYIRPYGLCWGGFKRAENGDIIYV